MNQLNAETKISISEAFDAMRGFLETYWEEMGKSSDDLAVLLGSLDRDEFRIMPLDPAMWYSWLEAVEKARRE